MNVIKPTVSQLSFAQPQVAPEAVSKPAVENALPSALADTQDNAKKSAGRDSASIEYEMYADEGDRFSRTGRGLSKLKLKKTKPDVPVKTKDLDSGKVTGVGVNNPGTSGATKFDKEIAQEQAEFVAEGSQASKLNLEKVVIVEPASVSLSVPQVNVNGKAVAPFSSESLKKAKQEFEEATTAADANKAETTVKEEAKAEGDTKPAPEKKKVSDTKKALIVVGIGAIVTPTVAAIVKLVDKYVGDDPASKFKVALAEAKIIDQVQQDVFDIAKTLAKMSGGKPFEPGVQWSLKSDAERLVSLETITIELEKAYVKLAGEYGISVSLEHSRSEDPNVEARAKLIESRLAVITAISKEITAKINAEAE